MKLPDIKISDSIRLTGRNYKYIGSHIGSHIGSQRIIKDPFFDGAPFQPAHSYPIGEDCEARNRHWRLQIKIAPKTMKDKRIRAIVTLLFGRERIVHTVSVGDMLPMGTYHYKVLGIIPPNPETKQLGWLDLAASHYTQSKLTQLQKETELPAQFMIRRTWKPFKSGNHSKTKSKDGQRILKGFYIWTWNKMGYNVRFPDLKHDNLVRIEGLDYKVDLEGDYADIKCVRQSSESKPPEPTVSLPIAKGEYTSRLQGYSLMLHIPDDELKKPTSKMKVTVRLHRQDTKVPDKVEQSVSVGETLYVNSYPYKVLGVIPPDPKAKRIGSLDISKLPTNYRKPSKTTPPVISDKTKEK